jgi:N-acetylneuraminic acid mutarotase
MGSYPREPVPPRRRSTFESGYGAIMLIDMLAVLLIVAASLAAYVWIDSTPVSAAGPAGSVATLSPAVPSAALTAAPSSAASGVASAAPSQSATPQPSLIYGKGSWETVDSLPKARWGAASVVLPDGRVMVIGGATGSSSNNATASVVIFDPKTSQWTAATSMLQARAYPMAVELADGSILVAGGSRNGQPLDTVERYNPTNGTWVATGRLNLPRTQGTLTLLADGRVLAAGGGVEAAPDWISTASTEVYDPNTGRWSMAAPMSVARAIHTATLLQDGEVLVTGGATTYHGSSGSVTARAEIFDPRSGRWRQVAPLPKPLYVHSAALMPDGHVLVAGGWWSTSNSDPSHGGVYIYDPDSDTWMATGSLVTPRAQFNLVALPDGRFLAIDGVDPAYHTLATSEIYDPSTGAWSTTGKLAVATMWPAVGLLPDGRVFIAGGALDALAGHVTAVSEIYTPAPK